MIEKIKPTILLALLMMVTSILYAIPANPEPITFIQPNGDTLTIRIKGDERIHWRETMDGYTLLFNKEGYLTYAYLDKYGDLQPSDMIATNIEDRNIVVHSFLNTIEKGLFFSDIQKQLMLKIWQIEDEAQNTLKNEEQIRGVTYKTLCALVDFPERPMKKTLDDFEPLMNQLGYTGSGIFGSVRDFFKETTYGNIDVQVTLCGIYTAENSKAYLQDLMERNACQG